MVFHLESYTASIKILSNSVVFTPGFPFQYMSDQYVKMYKSSKVYDNEPDIYIFSDPQWTGTDKTDISDPNCLCYFNTDTNCAGILGMRYFGEHKKGTLTLAWADAVG